MHARKASPRMQNTPAKVHPASTERVAELLRRSVPRDCVAAVADELKKDFVFSKKRTRRSNPGRQRRNNRFLSRREKHALGLYRLPRNGLRYADARPLHDMWCEYMARVLELDTRAPPAPGDSNWDSFTQSVYKADLHGSELRAVRSLCPSYVGKSGICLLDTKHTFTLLSRDNRLTTIPKKESVFEVTLGELRLVLFGKHLCVRPAERSVKKVKCQQIPDL